MRWGTRENRGNNICSVATSCLLWCSDLLSARQGLGFLLGIDDFALGLLLLDVALNLTGHSCEGSLNVSALLGRGLKESDAVMVSHLLSFLEGHSSPTLKICLVTD